MTKVERTYRAWMRAVERGYGKSNRVHHETIVRVDENIRRLKANYELAVREARANQRR